MAYPSIYLRGAYIDGELYSIDLSLVNNSWSLKYNNTTAILSGIVNNNLNKDFNKLIGEPVADGATIEFSGLGGLYGYRVVDEDGNGVTEFDVTIVPTYTSCWKYRYVKVPKTSVTFSSIINTLRDVHGWTLDVENKLTSEHEIIIQGYDTEDDDVSTWTDFSIMMFMVNQENYTFKILHYQLQQLMVMLFVEIL